MLVLIAVTDRFSCHGVVIWKQTSETICSVEIRVVLVSRNKCTYHPFVSSPPLPSVFAPPHRDLLSFSSLHLLMHPTSYLRTPLHTSRHQWRGRCQKYCPISPVAHKTSSILHHLSNRINWKDIHILKHINKITVDKLNWWTMWLIKFRRGIWNSKFA